MYPTFLVTLIITFCVFQSADASWFSNVVKDTSTTVHKAVKDTGAEINRAKERVTGSGGNVVAVQEIQKIGDELTATKAKAIELQDEKDVANGGLLALSAAVIGSVITMASTGMFGRHDRREKFLAAVEREWKLDRDGFDFALLPNYKRLLAKTPQLQTAPALASRR